MYAARIANQSPVCPNDPVAGNKDGDGVFIVGQANGAKAFGAADCLGDILVSARLTIGNLAEGAPYLFLKLRSRRGKRKRKGAALTREILLELSAGLC